MAGGVSLLGVFLGVDASAAASTTTDWSNWAARTTGEGVGDVNEAGGSVHQVANGVDVQEVGGTEATGQDDGHVGVGGDGEGEALIAAGEADSGAGFRGRAVSGNGHVVGNIAVPEGARGGSSNGDQSRGRGQQGSNREGNGVEVH